MLEKRVFYNGLIVAALVLVLLPAPVLAAPRPAPDLQGTCPCSIWSDSATPGQPSVSDSSAVEVGVKFRPYLDGYIIGLRFYKGSQNTGTHVGHLWSSDGTLLAEATFTGETASGWQEVTLDTPVQIISNTTYIASYHTDVGHYAFDQSYFATSGVDNPPLRALANGEDGPNGVYRYGASGFPNQSYNASNYWVDVVFDTTVGPDTTPPTVSSVSPSQGTSSVDINATVTARFSEAMDAATINTTTFELRDGLNALVPATVTYSGAARTATLDPLAALTYSTTYIATIRGGDADPRVRDLAGNPLTADYTWSFTTAAPPPPPPDEGPGGPILVIASTSNPFGRYYAEILRTEGFNAFTVTDISLVSASILDAHDLVILGEMSLTPAQVAMFSDWVTGGGNLIAMRPDKQLASLLGLTDASSTLSNAYLLVDTSAGPGVGIVDQTIQFHGTADLYTLNDATSLATLYSDATTPASHPAVTSHSVGPNGGQVTAFVYDLARSVVYTRQGNPAWAGQERDGTGPIRSDDMFYGAASFDPQPDWIDLNKVAIPQADEQQRLLANLILHMNLDRKPLPRFWYFPRGEKAVVIMTGDDHGTTGTAGRFEIYLAGSLPGCSVADWECVRSSSYIYTGNSLTDAQAVTYTAHGFEVGLHVNTGCGNWTPASLESFYTTQLSAWSAKYASIPTPSSNRTHCIAWSDWATQAWVELNHGIRLDTNYYYWPPSWVANRPGMFTGSGMPMRFADPDGTMIDVYQAVTQMTDESGQSYPFTANTLLDRALGPEGYYGAFTANMHTDGASHGGSVAIVASAQARGVPIVSGRQMLEWLDGRNNSSFDSLTWDGNTLSFTITVGTGARGLQAIVPTNSAVGVLTGITRAGNPLTYTTETVKGVEYARFVAAAGTYEATYEVDTTAPLIWGLDVSPGSGGIATTTWNTNELSDSHIVYGTSPALLALSATHTALVTSHTVTLTGLAPDTTYYYRVTSADGVGNAATYPDAGDPPASFMTPSASFIDTTVADFGAGSPGANVHVAQAADGELILMPTVGTEFSGSALPAGWSTAAWGSGGTATVSGGVLTLDGARAGTDALYGPGRSLEFVATFAAAAYQHVGFGLTYSEAPWAMFSTFGGGGLYARTYNAGVMTNTPIPGSWLGTPHRYRIAWNATSVAFYIDDTQVASHPISIAGSMRPLASDYTVGGDRLSVDWLHMSPYAASGTFFSRIFDADAAVDWVALSWDSNQPAGTTASFQTRSGNTPTPDGSWSAWEAVDGSGNIPSPTSQYVQYAALMATSNFTVTPVVEEVAITYAVLPAIVVNKTAAPDSVPEPGGAVTFTVCVTNTSGETVTVTSLVDDVHGDLDGQGTCAVPQEIVFGSSYECAFSAAISGNAGDSEADTVTARASDYQGNEVEAFDGATVTITDVLPAINATKTANPASVAEPGGTVTFTVRVTNTSVETATLTWLADDVHGDLDGQGSCAVPQNIALDGFYECAFSTVVTGSAGYNETDRVTARASDDERNEVEASDDAIVTITDVLPTIQVVKTANPAVVRAGDAVSFTFRVDNHSVETVTLSHLDDTVFDNLASECGLPASIPSSGFFECVILRTMRADHANTVTAIAEDDEGNTVTDSASASVDVVGPAIRVRKEASTETARVGDTITYTYTVDNAGDVTLTGVTAHDDRLGLIPLHHTTLAPGNIATGTATYLVQESDLPGPLTNTVTVTGTPPAGDVVINTATATVSLKPKGTIIYLPIVLNKYAPPAPDLVVEQITVAGSRVQVVIKNQGDAPVLGNNEFWVDLYVDPHPVPTAVNQAWDALCSRGIVWGVTAPALPLAVGQTITLTIGDDYYQDDYSHFPTPLPAGLPIYVQVDSANLNSTYGGVLENHEQRGEPYNNVSGPVFSALSTMSDAPAEAGRPAQEDSRRTEGHRLPLRP